MAVIGTDRCTESVADDLPCPQYRLDYVKLAAWVFAVLFGPALIALVAIAIWLA